MPVFLDNTLIFDPNIFIFNWIPGLLCCDGSVLSLCPGDGDGEGDSGSGSVSAVSIDPLTDWRVKRKLLPEKGINKN